MLRWSIIFFILSVLAAIFGFGGVAADTAWIAKTLFLIFMVLFAISFIGNFVQKKP